MKCAPLCVDSDEPQLFPTPVHYVLHTEVELTTHDGCVWLSCEIVEMFEADAVDFVVDVETAFCQYQEPPCKGRLVRTI